MKYPGTLMNEYSRLKTNMKKNYERAVGNDRDSVHDMRVAIKRLRAFFKLVESLNGNFAAKDNFKPFARFAKNTGSLRDSHVQQELADNYADDLKVNLQQYGTFLKQHEQDCLSSFHQFAEDDPLSHLKPVKKKIQAALGTLSPVWAETKAVGRLHNMRNHLVLMCEAPDPSDEVLHDIRKLTKSIHYTHDIVLACFDSVDKDKTYRETISSTHKLLGKWHDFAVSIGYIDMFLASSPDSASCDSCSRLKQHLAERQADLRTEVVSCLSGLSSKLSSRGNAYSISQ